MTKIAETAHKLKFAPDLLIGTYVWHPADDHLSWTDELVRIYGLTTPPARGRDFVSLIHPDDRARVEGETAVMMSPDAQTYSHTFRIQRPDGSTRVILDRGTIERDGEGRVSTLHGVNVDVTDEAHLNYSAATLLRASEDRYRKLFDAIDESFMIIEVRQDLKDGRYDYRIIEANPAFHLVTGLPTSFIGQWLRSAMPEVEEYWFETYGGVLRTREPARFENTVASLGRWYDVFAFPVDDLKDNHVAVLFTDISDRKKREADAQLIVEEINHRSKNMLGVVQVIARQSASNGADGFLGSFSDRVRALSASHDLLLRNDWSSVSVAELVRSQLLPIFDLSGGRITFDGPDLALTPVVTKAVGMALHELATNAAKYGAMSTEAGQVRITWSQEPGDGTNPRFALHWTERGGPVVTQPLRKGFGSKVTTWMVEANTGGTVAVDYAPDGLTWHLACPAAQVLV